jgi:hypothetical protein
MYDSTSRVAPLILSMRQVLNIVIAYPSRHIDHDLAGRSKPLADVRYRAQPPSMLLADTVNLQLLLACTFTT